MYYFLQYFRTFSVEKLENLFFLKRPVPASERGKEIGILCQVFQLVINYCFCFIEKQVGYWWYCGKILLALWLNQGFRIFRIYKI